MNKKIRYLAALVWMLALVLLPAGAGASESSRYTQIPTITENYVNPIYRDTVSESRLVFRNPYAPAPLAEYGGYVSEAAAAESFRGQMKQREEEIVVLVETTADTDGMLRRIAEAAMAHTGNPTEGDYLKWQYAGWRGTLGGYTAGGVKYLTLTYTLTYYTDAAQEQYVTNAVNALIGTLGLRDASKSSYEKVRAIYDYICSNVTYDSANAGNENYKLKHTAYAALADKTAVCQGYAVLFYRLALESGIDARVISGYGGGTAHGWNIVKLGSQYYNLDATWDAGRDPWLYFLKADNFSGHTRGENYQTAEFYGSYPMAASDFPEKCTHEAGSTVQENVKAASCTLPGSYENVTYCQICAEEMSRYTCLIPAEGHTLQTIPGRAADCLNTGLTDGQKCTVCGTVVTEQKTVAAKGHSWGTWKTTANATVFAPEKQTAVCSVCGAVKVQDKGTKLTAKIRVSASTLLLQKKQKTTACRVTFANGDSVKSWKSGDRKIAKVSGRADGTCTITAGNKTGRTKITVTLKSGKTATINVKVQAGKVAAKSVKLAATKITLKKKQKIQLSPVIKPVTCQEKVQYSSSNSKIAKVNAKGVITGVKAGKTKIKVKVGGKTVTCTVIVK
ncbi:transglutaminase domain-containing protein [Marvinbryantia formatexigens]|uniref:transglutaminase domain-containing protein n=1 Tax=Marvinbryantia formatexigens TaxID=168384 RepID=UPI0002E13168|nr:transglutaminase domain-containing protein [Marvinbryantia formatexigens]UWO23325.1 Ig-like domain-containing protein [Marvinbryantia formatexigens DSM 14469]SDG41464.1 Ig-like domain (group 2) [Marvinbryantia formatexigens]